MLDVLAPVDACWRVLWMFCGGGKEKVMGAVGVCDGREEGGAVGSRQWAQSAGRMTHIRHHRLRETCALVSSISRLNHLINGVRISRSSLQLFRLRSPILAMMRY